MTPAAAAADITSCDREAIHAPGGVQPHGALVVLGPDLRVVQASENVAAVFGTPAEDVLGKPVTYLPGLGGWADTVARLPTAGEPVLLGTVRPRDVSMNVVGHRSAGLAVLEFEPAAAGGGPPLSPVLGGFIAAIGGTADASEMARLTAVEIRRVTGFDRALVYRFDPDGTGVVVADDGNGRLPSYLGHRFPATDIPLPARELYRRNRVRLIPDAGYATAAVVPAVNPVIGGPLDMTFAGLRSVSPVHVEYMRNMGTAASLSVSVLRDGELWGLVACHHATPRFVPFEARTACDLLAQVFALQVAAREHAADAVRRADLKTGLTRLLARMAGAADFAAALAAVPADLLGFVHAGGAAVVGPDACHLVGATPPEAAVKEIAAWAARPAGPDVFATHAVPAEFPPAAAHAAAASGLLSVVVSRVRPVAVLWFRPEVVETVRWGGDPRKVPDAAGRISPRASFATWLETVRGTARPWLPAEVEAAVELRTAVLGVVLKQAEELAAVSTELARANRDLEASNAELEAFSYSVSHDLRAPLRHITGYAEILKEAGPLSAEAERCVAVIVESTEYAGKLVDNLLAFAQMGRTALMPVPVDMNKLVAEVRRDVTRSEAAGRNIQWHVGPLPAVVADPMMLKLAVRNLLSNAVKYTKSRAETVIAIDARAAAGGVEFRVADNGVGFDMRFRDKLFGVFQRLHRWEDYAGTGIGLANVKRIIQRHGGTVAAEGEVGRGATFSFTLPVTKYPPEG